MMFMITTPPTTMNTETMATAVMAIAPVSLSHADVSDSEAMIEKVSSWFGRRWR